MKCLCQNGEMNGDLLSSRLDGRNMSTITNLFYLSGFKHVDIYGDIRKSADLSRLCISSQNLRHYYILNYYLSFWKKKIQNLSDSSLPESGDRIAAWRFRSSNLSRSSINFRLSSFNALSNSLIKEVSYQLNK